MPTVSVTYVGMFEEVEIADNGQLAKHGQTIEVDPELAGHPPTLDVDGNLALDETGQPVDAGSGLLAQHVNWQPATPAKPKTKTATDVAADQDGD